MLIRSVWDAENFLINYWNDPGHAQDKQVTFEGCSLQIKLDPGTGEADAKMLRAVRMFQRHIELAYLLAKYGNLTARLSDWERDKLSIGFTVSPGSTKGNLDISGALRTLRDVLPAHWSPRLKGLVTCGVLVAFLAQPYVGHYSSYRANIDSARIAAEANVKVAEVEKRANVAVAQLKADARIKAAAIADAPMFDTPREFRQGEIVLASLAMHDPTKVVAFALSDYVAWRPALLDLAPYNGSIQWGHNAPLPARVAKAVAKSTRNAATAARRAAKNRGNPSEIETPWVTEVMRTHSAPGAMRLGMTDA
jgi:hypothetical protein